MTPVVPIPQPYTGGPNGRKLLQVSGTSDPSVDSSAVNKLTGVPPDLSQRPGVQASLPDNLQMLSWLWCVTVQSAYD